MNQSQSIAFRRYQDGDGPILARIRASEATNAGLRGESTLGLPPTEQQLHTAGSNAADDRFLVVELDGVTVGYSTMSNWQESSGVTIFLIDGHVTSEASGQGVASTMLQHMESLATKAAESMNVRDDAVFAGNASSNENLRTSLLENNGYAAVFSMVEMELSDLTGVVPSFVDGVEIATAELHERRLIWELDELAYEDRAFTTPASDSSFTNFLESAGDDLSLWFVVRDRGNVIAFVNSRDRETYAEITDVTVHPDHRRRGLARALLTHNLAELSRRGFKRARLHTNGEDISGALSLYQSVGFEICERRLRYRKAMGETKRLY